jgi:hypothetical protein
MSLAIIDVAAIDGDIRHHSSINWLENLLVHVDPIAVILNARKYAAVEIH